MKPGDLILIDGTVTAIVRAVRTPAELAEVMPMLSAEFQPATQDPLRVAVITMTVGDTDELEPGVIVEATEGRWETMHGDPITITRIQGHLC